MNNLLIVLKIFSVLLPAIKAVEEALPLPGEGKRKLELVLDVLKCAYEASTELSSGISWQKLVTVVVPMIEKIVAVHNSLGLFEKPPSPASKA